MRRSIAACWCLLLLLAACGVPDDKSKGAGLSQADLQASIVNDRRHLFDGSLSYTHSVSMSVGGRLTYDILLTARGQKSSHRRPNSYEDGGKPGSSATTAGTATCE